jgi:hypothetical protein
MIANRSAVANVNLVPSDSETVALAGFLDCVTRPGTAPLMVAPSRLVGELSKALPDCGRANNVARSISGGPGHDVIVEPGTRCGPESMNSTFVSDRSGRASFALLIFRITHSMAHLARRRAVGLPLFYAIRRKRRINAGVPVITLFQRNIDTQARRLDRLAILG